MKRVHAWAALAGALYVIGAPGRADDQHPPPLDPKPNVLLIVLDDVGVDKFQLYTPSATSHTPYIDSLASTGVHFTNAYAEPSCSVARATIMTGRYAFRTGLGWNDGTLYPYPLETSLAKMLHDGFGGVPVYECGAFGKWHLIGYPAIQSYGDPIAWKHPTNTTQGLEFDWFNGHMGNVNEENVRPNLDHYHWYNAHSLRDSPTDFGETKVDGGAVPCPTNTYSAERTCTDALDWINQQTQPFFAYVCFNSPHAPLQVPPLSRVGAATQMQINNMGYQQGEFQHFCTPPNPCPDDLLFLDWMLESVDSEIQQLVLGMDPAKRDNLVVVIVADNGTPNPFLAPPYQNGHGKFSCYEQGIKVPLIVWGRGVDNHGLACGGLVHTVDILPTIAAMTGAQLSPSLILDGTSFWQLAVHPTTTTSNRTQVFVQDFFPYGAYTPGSNDGKTDHERGIRDDRYKYIRKYHASQTPQLKEEAYDLWNDPLEQHNLLTPPVSPPVQVRINALKNSMTALSGP